LGTPGIRLFRLIGWLQGLPFIERPQL
jgi:hypothetical protein